MNKSFVYIIIAILCVAMSACLDDDNNYNYDKLNELQGGYQSIGGLKDDYNPLAELSQCILDSSNGSIINVI